MAEDLDDGEFWLPSHFLTDDDILMDFDFSAPKVPNSGLGFVGYGSSSSNSNSDLELTSGCTETESDEEDILLSGLTRKIARVDLQDSSCPVHSKMVWAPSNGVQYNQAKQQPLPQNRATNNNKSNNKSNGNNNSNRPLGLPPSAWPTLQQVQAQNQAHPMPPQPMFVGPKRECNGTGVFLPRSVTTTPSVPRKKADGNATKSSKTGKGSQSQSSNRRNASATTTPTASNNDIQLPQEWTY
uniref:Uncharacterized protein n=1 Tax=Chenopodium quinoa TaxID=63459 RepID=A0A803KWH9_CHEQI